MTSAPSIFWISLETLAARGGTPALVSRTASLSYAELAARAGEVTRHLRRAGVLPGTPVGLLSQGRAFDELVALVGILAAGAICVPLDASAPAARLAGIMRARNSRALVCDEGARALASGVDQAMGDDAVPKLLLDPEGRVTLDPDSARPRDEAAPRLVPVACILHTSGSTGTPKPVPITWEGLDAFTQLMIDLCDLKAGDRVLRVAELVFDLAWFDHLATLRAGATLVTMTRRDLAAGTALKEAISALGPNVIYGVPSMFMKLTAALGADETLPEALRTVFFAGEVFPPRELAKLALSAPGASLFNLYGPTETNVCTYHRVDRSALDGTSETPIGIACPYAVCELMAEDGSFVDGPGIGELFVSGPTTLGHGPLGTRDLVERKSDGLFYFRGRIDRMVKIRGYRVEPGEVEAQLASHPAVQQAAVVPHEDARLGKILHAHVVLHPESATPMTPRDLRMALSEKLPPYMVPEKVQIWEELPRTVTGKIDYQKLSGA